jgi:hypothetical protein
MDQSRFAEIEFQLQHRHGDGTWGMFEERPRHHSPAEHDPEREWAAHDRLYACTSCDEQVVIADPLERPPLAPGDHRE